MDNFVHKKGFTGIFVTLFAISYFNSGSLQKLGLTRYTKKLLKSISRKLKVVYCKL